MSITLVLVEKREVILESESLRGPVTVVGDASQNKHEVKIYVGTMDSTALGLFLDGIPQLKLNHPHALINVFTTDSNDLISYKADSESEPKAIGGKSFEVEPDYDLTIYTSLSYWFYLPAAPRT